MKVLIISSAVSLFAAALTMQTVVRAFGDNQIAFLIISFVTTLCACLITLRIANRLPESASLPRPREGNRRKRQNTATNFDTRETGTVKWFNRSKGFGFIIQDNGEEIFVHHRSIRSVEGRRLNLRDGQSVSYAVVSREKGVQAEDVVGD